MFWWIHSDFGGNSTRRTGPSCGRLLTNCRPIGLRDETLLFTLSVFGLHFFFHESSKEFSVGVFVNYTYSLILSCHRSLLVGPFFHSPCLLKSTRRSLVLRFSVSTFVTIQQLFIRLLRMSGSFYEASTTFCSSRKDDFGICIYPLYELILSNDL